MPSSDEKLFAALTHGAALIGFPFIAPLVAYFAFKERGGFAFNQAREGLNFQITVILGCTALAITIIGIAIIWLYLLFAWVCLLFALIQVVQGREFRFPLTLRLVK